MASRLEKAQRMAEALGYSEPNAAAVEAIARAKEDPTVFIKETEGGFIVGQLARAIGSHELEAHEKALYSEDGSGPGLIAAFEAWAKDQGAVRVVMCFPRARRLPGYRVQAVQMVKDL